MAPRPAFATFWTAVCLFSALAFSAQSLANVDCAAELVSSAELVNGRVAPVQATATQANWMEVLQSVPSPVFAELTPEMRQLLERHPLWQTYRQYPASDLQFSFQLDEMDIGAIGPDEICSVFKDECIQAHFVAATLRALFPSAHLYGHPLPGKNYISFFITDPADSWTTKCCRSGHYF